MRRSIDHIRRGTLLLAGLGCGGDDFIANDLGIDVFTNFQDEELVRAGFSGARLGLPSFAFLAERHDIEIRSGVLWTISDFGRGPHGLRNDPLGGPALGHSELVFTLPNGLLAFALGAAEGGAIVNFSGLLQDFNQADFRHRIAISLFAKYAQGVEVVDEVRAYALANFRELGLSNDDLETLIAIYPEAAPLAAILDADRELYLARGLELLGLRIEDPEPISAAFATFHADVNLATAAGDLLVTSDDLGDNLDLLDPELQVLGSGSLDRNDWIRFYVRSLCLFSSPLENQPAVQVCDAAFATDP